MERSVKSTDRGAVPVVGVPTKSATDRLAEGDLDVAALEDRVAAPGVGGGQADREGAVGVVDVGGVLERGAAAVAKEPEPGGRHAGRGLVREIYDQWRRA